MKRYRLCAALAALGLAGALDAAVFASSAAATAPVGVASATAATSSGTTPVKAPAPPAGAFINRPTIPLAQYKALKSASPALPAKTASAPTAPPHGFTVTAASGFNGFTQANTAGFFPSDSNGVIGGSSIAEIVNSNLVTYSTAGVQKSNRSLNTLANYSAQSIFDPRIIYDANWKRYVISAEAFPESSTVQLQFVMVSKTSNPAGAYYVFSSNTHGWCGGTNPDWDYPQLGQTQDAIVITGSCFNSTGEQPDVFGIAKAAIYNGQGWSVPVFGRPGEGTLTPANVYDNRPTDYLLSTNQHMVGFQNPQSGGYATISSDTAITGFQAFAVPRSAGQAGCTTTSCHLDTSDGRFVNDSSQFGDQLWNVATYGFGGVTGSFATPYWGQFSIAGSSTTQHGAAVTDGCSDDFNASLVTSTAGKMWLNYTSTDPQGSGCGQTFVRQMEAGRTASTAANSLDNIINPFTSPAELTGNFDSNFGVQRWGDTSSVSLLNSTTAWTLNNSVVNANSWGTRWEKMTQ